MEFRVFIGFRAQGLKGLESSRDLFQSLSCCVVVPSTKMPNFPRSFRLRRPSAGSSLNERRV